jgi:uncharacterized protein
MSTPVPPILRECHRLRKHLRDLQAEIDRGPRVLKAHQQKLAAEEQAHKDSYDTLKKLKLKQKEDEGTLKQTEALLDKLHRRSMEVTTMKEMEATKSEIAQATGKKNTLEDAILATMTEIEERTADLPNVEKRWADAQKEFADYQVEAKERLERLLEDQKASTAELARQEGLLPEEVRGQYARLVKSYGPEGLAAVQGRTCQQCRTALTEDRRDQLAAGAFVCCSNCGRALYPAA